MGGHCPCGPAPRTVPAHPCDPRRHRYCDCVVVMCDDKVHFPSFIVLYLVLKNLSKHQLVFILLVSTVLLKFDFIVSVTAFGGEPV